MKKFLALVLVLCLVASLGTAAFAAGSVTKDETSTKTTAALPGIPEGAGLDVCFKADDTLDYVVPEENIIILAVGDADSLEDADKEAFLAAYDAVKEVKDQVVKYFFWLNATEEYATIPEGEYVALRFTCEGENVKVLLNGEEVEVVAGDAANEYLAKLPAFGAVAILCDAE